MKVSEFSSLQISLPSRSGICYDEKHETILFRADFLSSVPLVFLQKDRFYMKILFLTNVPSPYRVDFFNELGKHCDLTVLFEKKTSDERDKSWLNYEFRNFKGIFLKGRSIYIDKAVCPEAVKYVRSREYDHIIVTNIASPTGILAITYMRLHRIPYWIEGDGGFVKSTPRMRAMLKRFMISGAKGCFSTGKFHDEYYLSYGAKPNRLHRYPFTSLWQSDLMEAGLLTEQDRVLLRKKLQIPEEKVILYPGSSLTEDRLSAILLCARQLGNAYGIYLIGSGCADPFFRADRTDIPENVHPIRVQDEKQAAMYYGAADCLVLSDADPASSSVIKEALNYGLPVLAPDDSEETAGLDAEYPGVILLASSDPSKLAECIKTASGTEYRTSLQKTWYELIRNRTIHENSDAYSDYLAGRKRSLIRELSKEQLGIPQEKKIILYVGRMLPEKGVGLQLDSAIKLCRDRNDLLFLFIGGDLRERFQAALEKSRPDCVESIRYLTKEYLKIYFRAASVLCLPTRKDVWGLVINEAMTFGLPVISSAYCGAGTELIEDHENGLIMPSLDADALADCIEELMSGDTCSEYERKTFAKICRYTIEQMAISHIEILSGNDTE